MAQHIAHLFIRDPVTLFAEKLEQDLEKDMDHFEVSQYESAILERKVVFISEVNSFTAMHIMG